MVLPYPTHMKIYTRTGDDGSTGLFGGSRVGKDDARVEAYGTVDEANAALGLARAELAKEGPVEPELEADLAQLQSLLFDLGADLATPGGSKTRDFIQPIQEADVDHLEALIDRYSEELPPLTHFILPGGTAASAALQLTRAVLRRAERHAVALARHEDVGHHVLPLLNRLSDLFFVLARVACVRAGEAEVVWVARKPERKRRPTS